MDGWHRTTIPSLTHPGGDKIEASVEPCPHRFRDDIAAIFPGTDTQDLLILTTCQKTRVDLVTKGQAVDDEKDRLLERFFFLARRVVHILSTKGYWVDYIDPCSGLSMEHRETCAVYDEVAALCTLCGFRVQNAGCCKVALHPSWGSSVYPATIFAKAPLEEVEKAWREALVAILPRHPPYCECCGGRRPGGAREVALA